MPSRESSSVACGLREPDQEQGNRCDGNLPDVSCEQIERRDLWGRQPARHRAYERDPVRAEIEQVAFEAKRKGVRDALPAECWQV
jgi:hypothetical protein